jgi:Protein of unknown function (DUF2971)
MTYLSGALCHYTKGEAAFEHILHDQVLRMSPYARMRDPLENRELAFVSATAVDDSQAEDIRLLHLGELIQQVRNRMVLLSLTADAEDGYGPEHEPFMRAWARARLWEQYAQNHAGVCIVFDRVSLLKDLRAHLSARGPTAAKTVDYSPRGFTDTATSQIDLTRFNPYDLPALARFVIERQHDLFFVKTLDWKSEHEFRVIHSPDEASGEGYVYVPFLAGSVRAVIAGERFAEARLDAARATCDQVGVELLRIEWRAGIPRPTPIG